MRMLRLVGAVAMAAVAGAAVAATGEYWQVKQKMSIEGMSMPAMENRVCKPLNAAPEDMAATDDKNCRMTDFQTRGNKTSYRFECTGKDAASGSGEFEQLSPDAYRGRNVMRSAEGEMVMEFEGRKVGGACDPEEPMKKMQAQAAQAQAQQCRAQGESLAPPERNPQLPPEFDFRCDSANKAAYCEGVKAKQGSIADRDDFRSVAGTAGWRRSFEFCGFDAAGLEKRFCDEALAEKDYYFVAEACETEARRIAATCAGRDGTSLAAAGQSDLLPICAKYGPGAAVMVEQGSSADPAAAGQQAAPPAKESAFDKLKKGTKGLKDLMKIPGT
ncbi:MAG: DUF3617 domain-containing protein [Steroidobacteraceae bacterium]|jgi:hypothetical protein|nr:DUF3617 domain-containing protein [Steroidobacteraceae bacterium]